MKKYYDTSDLSISLLNYFFKSNPQVYVISSEELKPLIGKQIDLYQQDFKFKVFLIKGRDKYLETYSAQEAEERYYKSISNLFEVLSPKIMPDTIVIVPSQGLMHPKIGVLRPYFAPLIAKNYSIIYPDAIYPNGDGSAVFASRIGLEEKTVDIDKGFSDRSPEAFALMCMEMAKPLNAANQAKFLEFDDKVNLGTQILAIFTSILVGGMLYKLLQHLENKPKPTKRHMTVGERIIRARNMALTNAAKLRQESGNNLPHIKRRERRANQSKDILEESLENGPLEDSIENGLVIRHESIGSQTHHSVASEDNHTNTMLFLHETPESIKRRTRRDDVRNDALEAQITPKKEKSVGSGSATKKSPPLQKRQSSPRASKENSAEPDPTEKIINLLPNLLVDELSALEGLLKRDANSPIWTFTPKQMTQLLEKLDCHPFDNTRDKNQHHRIRLPDGVRISSLIHKGPGTRHDHSAPIHRIFFDDLRKSFEDIGIDAALVEDIWRQKIDEERSKGYEQVRFNAY